MNKKRYIDIESNFNLDLTYILDRLIAMGVPAEKYTASLYRNNAAEVARFFNQKHPDNYRIFNACPELPYDPEPFDNSVVSYDIQDHTPPTMDEFVTFLADAERWLCAHPDNVIAVHCKGGKGRTGSLCCAWLMYNQQAVSADAALALFAHQRTDSKIGGKPCGVETPSQVRYVHQLWAHLKEHQSWSVSDEVAFDETSRSGVRVPARLPIPPVVAPSISLARLEFEGNFIARLVAVVGKLFYSITPTRSGPRSCSGPLSTCSPLSTRSCLPLPTTDHHCRSLPTNFNNP